MKRLDKILSRLPDAECVEGGWDATCPRLAWCRPALRLRKRAMRLLRIDCEFGCPAGRVARCLNLKSLDLRGVRHD